jgi:thioredoxin-related protein
MHFAKFLFILTFSLPTFAQVQKHMLKPVYVKRGIYRADVDAKKEITEALQAAKKDNKRVFLVFGGNWCYDCHVLDGALRDPAIAPTFDKNYELVHVDIGRADNNLDIVKKYKINLDKGVPAVAVLDATGKSLFVDKGGEFESARSMFAEDLLAFFEKWKAPSR